ncbi:MAG: ribonuclease HII [Ignavibacteriaceae bacterium]|nr:ribonuclease HII [Ignavibacteriaceae bacterium]
MRDFDDKFRDSGYKIVAGTDEAGRGPLAGPVVAAAVILNADVTIDGIDDSKKLTKLKRDELFKLICTQALDIGFTVVSHERIDEINILKASLEAMKLSVNKLEIKPDIILIDGNKPFSSEIKTETIVGGDAKSESIAAASIIAKVIRDEIMCNLDLISPGYNWSQNKGYPTKLHIEAIKNIGLSQFHRKSFTLKYSQKSLFDTNK